jgi:hypothetical protein
MFLAWHGWEHPFSLQEMKMKITRQVRLCVRELAEERNIDERELASQARMNVNVIRRMFANQQIAEMRLNQLMKVAVVLDVPTSALFEDD